MMVQSPAIPVSSSDFGKNEHKIDILIRENVFLKSIHKRKSEFLTLAVHDMVNPLGFIIGMLEETAQMIEDNDIDIGWFRQNIQSVLLASNKMASLINDLRVISSTDTKLIEMEYSQCNMNDIIGECVNLFSPIAKRKNIALHYEEAKTLPVVLADKKKISSVIENLVSNAIKYSHPEGRVILSARPSKNHVVVSCRDFGQGFNAEETHEVFRSCRKFSAKPTANETSTGLGLMIVKKFVTMHKGKVWLQSTKGEGSAFYFSVPVNNGKQVKTEPAR